MAQLEITRGYANGETLLEADLDAIQGSLTTFFNSTGITDDNIQTGGIDGGSKLVNASVSTAKLEALTVTSSKIAASALTTTKVVDLNVTSDKIAISAVTSAKIASSSLIDSNFASASVTTAKLASVNLVVASTAISYTTTGTSEEAVTNASVTITTTGKRVWVGLQGTSADTGYVKVVSNTGAVNQQLRIYRDSTLILDQDLALRTGNPTALKYPPNMFWTIDTSVTAGTYTYTVKLLSSTAGDLAILGSPKMYAFEIV